jgi:hypothetical protein
VVMPKDEVARLRALGPTERKAVLGELDHELRRRPISASKKQLVVSLVAIAAGVVIGVFTVDDETKPPSVTVPTVLTLPLPTIGSSPTVSITGVASTATNG